MSQTIKTGLYVITDPKTKIVNVRFVYGFKHPPPLTPDKPTVVSSEGRIMRSKTQPIKHYGTPENRERPYLITSPTDGGANFMHNRIARTFLDTPDDDKYDTDHISRNKQDNSIKNLRQVQYQIHRADKADRPMAGRQNILPVRVTFKTGPLTGTSREYASIPIAASDPDIHVSEQYLRELVHDNRSPNYTIVRIQESDISGEIWLPAVTFCTQTNQLLKVPNFECSNMGKFKDLTSKAVYIPRPNASQSYAEIQQVHAARITLSTFSPDTYFPGACACHINDDKTKTSVNIPIIGTNVNTGEKLYFDNGTVEAQAHFNVSEKSRISAAKKTTTRVKRLFGEWEFENNMDHDRTRLIEGELWLYDKTTFGESAEEKRLKKKRKRPEHFPPPKPNKTAATGHNQAKPLRCALVPTKHTPKPSIDSDSWVDYNGHQELATKLRVSHSSIGKAVNRATPVEKKGEGWYYVISNS